MPIILYLVTKLWENGNYLLICKEVEINHNYSSANILGPYLDFVNALIYLHIHHAALVEI
jgi:hypothetical protein